MLRRGSAAAGAGGASRNCTLVCLKERNLERVCAECAGVIHTDFEKKFIRAETVSYDDFVECKGLSGAKEKGLLRLEGKDYVVSEGDVMLFRTGA